MSTKAKIPEQRAKKAKLDPQELAKTKQKKKLDRAWEQLQDTCIRFDKKAKKKLDAACQHEIKAHSIYSELEAGCVAISKKYDESGFGSNKPRQILKFIAQMQEKQAGIKLFDAMRFYYSEPMGLEKVKDLAQRLKVYHLEMSNPSTERKNYLETCHIECANIIYEFDGTVGKNISMHEFTEKYKNALNHLLIAERLLTLERKDQKHQKKAKII